MTKKTAGGRKLQTALNRRRTVLGAFSSGRFGFSAVTGLACRCGCLVAFTMRGGVECYARAASSWNRERFRPACSLQHLQLSSKCHQDLVCLDRQSVRCDRSPGPPHLYLGCLLWKAQHLDGAVLRPITAPAVHLSGGSPTTTAFEPDHGAKAVPILARTFEANAQSRMSVGVSIKFGFGAVLRYDQIQPAITVEITHRGTALFAVNLKTALLAWYGVKFTRAVALEKHSAARVVTRRFRLHVKKVLCEEQILGAVTVEIPNTDAKYRRHLSFNRQ